MYLSREKRESLRDWAWQLRHLEGRGAFSTPGRCIHLHGNSPGSVFTVNSRDREDLPGAAGKKRKSPGPGKVAGNCWEKTGNTIPRQILREKGVSWKALGAGRTCQKITGVKPRSGGIRSGPYFLYKWMHPLKDLWWWLGVELVKWGGEG